MYAAKKAGSTEQPAVFVDKKSRTQYSEIYRVLSRLLRVLTYSLRLLLHRREGYSKGTLRGKAMSIWDRITRSRALRAWGRGKPGRLARRMVRVECPASGRRTMSR